MGERYEKAALKSTNFRDMSADAVLALNLQQAAAHGCCKTRAHTDDSIVAVGEITIDNREPRYDGRL
jgi:hypothetical protein